MAETANPTTPGMHNHVGGRPPARDPANPRGEINSVFGVHAKVIEGCVIEDGHGAQSVEQQLAAYLARVQREQGDAAARAKFERLLLNKSVNADRLAALCKV